MNDQAENLRKAIEGLKGARLPDSGRLAEPGRQLGSGRQPDSGGQLDSGRRPDSGGQPDHGRQPAARRARAGPARVFAVTSGKGGVGKTNISANLAIALGEMGFRAAIIDADFGLSNVEVLFGAMPRFKLADAIRGEKTIDEILCDGPAGVKFISGGTGVEELVRLDAEQAAALIAGLSEADAEFDAIIIDTGAGLSDTVLCMCLAADEVILVATPEPTSVTDAYALIKLLSSRDREKEIRLVVNRAETPGEAEDIASKLAHVAARFLELDLRGLGYVLSDPLVVRSVKQQTPFMIGYPRSRASMCVRDIAARMMEGGAPRADGDGGDGKGLSGFLSRISRLLSAQYRA